MAATITAETMVVNENRMEEPISKLGQLPEVVYHYTSMDVVLKIIATKELWATNVRYLNDVSEFQFFLETAQRRLPEIIPDMNHVDLAAFAKQASQNLGCVPDFLRVPFVTSFSLYDDSLTHWRSYCPAGNGVSIGFRTGSLLDAYVQKVSLPGTIVPKPVFGEVYYPDPKNTETVDSVIREVYSAAQDDVRTRDWPLLDAFLRRLMSIASFIKHPSFENEHEYRLTVAAIQWRPDLLCFRPNPSTLVPYVKVNIPRFSSAPRKIGESENTWNAIASITIGPTPNMALSSDSLSAFCWTKGIDPEIRRSRVPYREW
jgi:hypothetical protein